MPSSVVAARASKAKPLVSNKKFFYSPDIIIIKIFYTADATIILKIYQLHDSK